MLEYSPIDSGCEIRCAHEILRIEQWGRDSVRVRAAQHRIPADDVGALEQRPAAPSAAVVTRDGDSVRLVAGELTVVGGGPAGRGGGPPARDGVGSAPSPGRIRP